MATQASLDQIQNLYIAFYGRPADLAGQTYWADELEAANGDLTAIIDAFASSEEYDSQYGDLTNEELVNALYQQILGRDAEQAGLDYYVGELEAGNITEGGIALAILNGATGDDATTMANRKAVADEFTAAVEAGDKEYGDDQLAAAKALLAGVTAETDPADVDVDAVVDSFPTAEEPVDPGTPGEEFMLTASTDVLTGTENNDTFNAYLSQNEFIGGVSNTLSSADRIDGGAGNDSLYAELVPEFFGATGDNQIDVQPRISNVETIELEARDLGLNDDAEIIFGEDVEGDWDVISVDNTFTTTFDAKNVTDVDSIGSSFSDGDLVIENLTTLTSDGVARNTAEITITMDHTDNFNSDSDASDLTVYFDEDYLLAGQDTTTSQANYWLLDEDSVDYVAAPLLNIERDGVSLTIDGTPVEIRMDADTYAAADTWEAFAAGLQARIDTMVSEGTSVLEGVTVIVDYDNTDETYNDQGVLVVMPAITLVDSQGRDLTPTGFTSPEEATGAFDIYGRFDNVASEMVDQPISVSVDLHKVGRHGEGGNLIIGGKSQDGVYDEEEGEYTGEGQGIEVFNISVLGADDKPSNLGQILSTNGALRTINIETASEYVSGDTHASLTVRGEAANGADASPFGGTVDMINATAFLGDLTIGNETAAQNVNTLNATGGGDVSFNADITEEGVYNYTTGAGNDDINVSVDGDAVDTIGTSLQINAGNGDNEVVIDVFAEDVSQATMEALDNLSITTGTGEDYVEVNQYGRFDIETGAGSDFVFINSDDDASASNGAWAFGSASQSTAVWVDRVLYQAELTVTFAGFESTVTVDTTAANNFIATQVDINTAIIEAIESNPELARMLETQLGDGLQALSVESIIDGLNELSVTLNQPEVVASGAVAPQVNLGTNDLTAVQEGLVQTGAAADSAAADTAVEAAALIADGTLGNDGALFAAGVNDFVAVADLAGAAAGTAISADAADALDDFQINNSVINLGSGTNDLVVLDSHDDSANTIVFDQTFGKVSIVNFFDGAAIVAGGESLTVEGDHILDFTAYLTNVTSTSNSTLSQVAVATDDTATTAQFSANTVVLTNFNALNAEDGATALTFADLTGAQALAEMNAGAGFASLASGATANLVGTDLTSVMLVENNLNLGEYKVFAVTASGTAGNDQFTSVELLGTVDFGATITDTAVFA